MNGEAPFRKARWTGWIAIAAVTAVLVAARSLPYRDALETFFAWSPNSWLFGGSIVLGVVVGIPGSVLAVLSGALFGASLGFAFCWTGCVLGSSACFGISRVLLKKRIQESISKRDWVLRLEKALSLGGWKLIALLRLTPLVPFVVLNYLAGATRIRFRDSLLGTAVAIVPAILVWAMIGSGARSEVTGDEDAGRLRWGLAALGLAATAALGRKARTAVRDILSARRQTARDHV